MYQISVTSDADAVASRVSYGGIKKEIGNDFAIFSYNDKDLLIDEVSSAVLSVIETKYKCKIVEKALAEYPLTKSESSAIAADILDMPVKTSALEKLKEYFSHQSSMSVEGFVNFRLQKYKTSLSALAERYAHKYEAEREYNEFIALLSLFVASRPHEEEHIHVVLTKSGGFALINNEKRDITTEYARKAAYLCPDDEIAPEDILLTSLLTAAPLGITFHNARYMKIPDLLKTVEKIFPNRIFYCNDCNLCR